MDLNKAMLIGNVTRDPEIRITPNGQTVCSFGLATNRIWLDASGQKQEQTEFHNIVTWGKLAEICGQYLNKGRKIFVEGRIQTREWQTPDGSRKQRTEIVAENIILLDRASQTTSRLEGETAEVSSQEPVSPPESGAAPNDELSEEEIKVEDIPF
jgi:single-strand DNA-binding protein